MDANGLKMLDRAKQVDERPAEPGNGPGHHHIEFARLASLNMAFIPGRWSRPLEPLMPASR